MENKKLNNASWGIILIGLGVLFLLNQVFPGIAGVFWGFIFAASFALGGLWFFSQYNQNRNNWGLLIPAYVMFAIAGLIGMAVLLGSTQIGGMLIPAYVMFSVAAPFLYVFSRDTQKNWWALIPGGITGMIGVGFLMALMWQVLPIALILVGAYLLVRNASGKSEKPAAAAANGRNGSSPEVIAFEPLRMGQVEVEHPKE